MFLNQIVVNLFLFTIGVGGILTNRKNVLVVLMCIEILLLSVNLNFLTIAMYLDDYLGQIFSIFILTVAAAESSIGLAVLIIYYRFKNNISISDIISLKN